MKVMWMCAEPILDTAGAIRVRIRMTMCKAVMRPLYRTAVQPKRWSIWVTACRDECEEEGHRAAIERGGAREGGQEGGRMNPGGA